MGRESFVPDTHALWHAATPYPANDDLLYPAGIQHGVVHRAGNDGYRFLHDCAIVAHEGLLFAAWYNCPEGEIAGESLIRGRRSIDGGKTWSDVEVIAADHDRKGVFYVPVQFLSMGGTLCAYVSTMTGHDRVVSCEAFRLGSSGALSDWVPAGTIAPLFLPNAAPVRAADGKLLMAGRCAARLGQLPTIPAVARSTTPFGEWEVVRLLPRGVLPDGRSLKYPETTLIAEDANVTAFVRNEHGFALVFLSTDSGRTWRGPFEQDMPLGAAKMCSGILSTGQRYIVFSTPSDGYRDLLTIAVSRSDEPEFCAVLKVAHGFSETLGCGPEWSYPSAVEFDGTLFIVYTSEKHHCVMARIPMESLLVRAGSLATAGCTCGWSGATGNRVEPYFTSNPLRSKCKSFVY